MNCSSVRRVLLPYLDSELSPERSLEVARHLDTCDDCRRRAEGERRIEEELRRRLSAAPPEAAAAWRRATAAAFGRRRRILIGTAAAAALLITATLWMLWPRSPSDLVRAMEVSHRKFLAGDLAPTIDSADVSEVQRYFVGRLPFPVELGPAPSDVQVLGGRCCYLDHAPCAFVMVHADQNPVSIFVLDDSRLAEFPEAAPILREGALHCASGELRAFALRTGSRLVGGIGRLEPHRLESLVRSIAAAPRGDDGGPFRNPNR